MRLHGYAPHALIGGGVSTCVTIFIVLHRLGLSGVPYLWLLLTSAVAAGSGAWLGSLRCAANRATTYLLWGLLFSGLSGALTTLLLKVGMVEDLNLETFAQQSGRPALEFIVVVGLVFGYAALATDRGGPQADGVGRPRPDAGIRNSSGEEDAGGADRAGRLGRLTFIMGLVQALCAIVALALQAISMPR